jgi:MarR family transcriptional regulator, organic hydroperoxide resistance regulator
MAQAAPARASTKPEASTDPAAPEFAYRRYPFYRLSRTSGRYNHAMERALKPLGLDQARWRVLVILAEDGPLSIGDIADAAVYKASTLSRIISRMQAAGHVMTSPRASDNRVAEVSLTLSGRDLYARSMTAASRVYRRAAGALSPAEFERLSELLNKLADAFAP